MQGSDPSSTITVNCVLGMVNKLHNVVIVGASFAGLAVAYEAGDGCLILDKKNIGERQTSACALPERFVDYYGLQEAILQKHENIYFHLPLLTNKFKLPLPYVTIDYKKFCKLLFEKSGARFLLANVKKLESNKIETQDEVFQSNIVVNSAGWNLSGDSKDKMAFGVEAVYQGEEEGLRFWLDSRVVRNGYGWLFPAGGTVRIGIISYEGKVSLNDQLHSFAKKLGYRHPIKVHGGWLPYTLNDSMHEGFFKIGDSAGQCFALTGEGIKCALYFGRICGRILNEINSGKLSLDEGLKSYTAAVLMHKRKFENLTRLQQLTVKLPAFMLHPVAVVSYLLKPLSYKYLNSYLKEMN